MKQGDTEAKELFYNSNLRMVVSIAKRYRGLGLDIMDIIQEGNLGLLSAVEKFDLSKGVKFSTFAYILIRHSIVKAIADQGRGVKTSQYMNEQMIKLNRAERELKVSLGHEPTDEELAARLGIRPGRLRELKSHRLMMDSLDRTVGEEGNKTVLGDIVKDEKNPDPEEVVCADQFQQELYTVLDSLPKKEREIVLYRLGLDGHEKKTLTEVAEILGMKKEEVRQLENRALRKFRLAKFSKKLVSYL